MALSISTDSVLHFSRMKAAILFTLVLLMPGFAADSKPLQLEVKEYRVSYGFILWLTKASFPSDERKHGEEQVDAKVFVHLSGIPVRGESSMTYMVASQRMIYKHTRRFHEALSNLVSEWNRHGGKQPPTAKNVKILQEEDIKSDPHYTEK